MEKNLPKAYIIEAIYLFICVDDSKFMFRSTVQFYFDFWYVAGIKIRHNKSMLMLLIKKNIKSKSIFFGFAFNPSLSKAITMTVISRFPYLTYHIFSQPYTFHKYITHIQHSQHIPSNIYSGEATIGS